jgi:hypothetical protein
VVIGEKDGFKPDLQFPTLRKGDRTSIRVRPGPPPPPPRSYSPLPWITFGAGTATAGIGATFHILSKTDLDTYHQTGDDTFRNQAWLREAIAITCYAAGGVMLAAGAFLLYRDVSQPAPADPKRGPPLTFVPIATKDTLGMALTSSF